MPMPNTTPVWDAKAVETVESCVGFSPGGDREFARHRPVSAGSAQAGRGSFGVMAGERVRHAVGGWFGDDGRG